MRLDDLEYVHRELNHQNKEQEPDQIKLRFEHSLDQLNKHSQLNFLLRALHHCDLPEFQLPHIHPLLNLTNRYHTLLEEKAKLWYLQLQ